MCSVHIAYRTARVLKGGEGSRCFPLSACEGTRDAKSPNLANFCKVQVSADFFACEGGLRHISRLHKTAAQQTGT